MTLRIDLLPIALSLGLLALPVVSAAPQARDSASMGIVDGTALREFADEEGTEIEINIPGPLLKSISRGLQSDEPDAAGAISSLAAVHALVITVRPDMVDSAQRKLRSLGDDLLKHGWSSLARVRDKDSNINVLVRHIEDQGWVDGIVVLVFDREDRSLVFANIAGRLDLTKLGEIADDLDIPGMEALDDLPGVSGGPGHGDAR